MKNRELTKYMVVNKRDNQIFNLHIGDGIVVRDKKTF